LGHDLIGAMQRLARARGYALLSDLRLMAGERHNDGWSFSGL
jgi:hypothetical protein